MLLHREGVSPLHTNVLSFDFLLNYMMSPKGSLRLNYPTHIHISLANIS